MQKEELHKNIADSIRSGIDPKVAVASAYALKRKAEKAATPIETDPLETSSEQLAEALSETVAPITESAPVATVTASGLTDDMRAAILKKKQNRKFE